MKPTFTFAAAALSVLLLVSANASASETCEDTCTVTYTVQKHQNPTLFDVEIYLETPLMDQSQYMSTAYNLQEQNVNNFAIRTAIRVCRMANNFRLPGDALCSSVLFTIEGALEGYGEQDCTGL